MPTDPKYFKRKIPTDPISSSACLRKPGARKQGYFNFTHNILVDFHKRELGRRVYCPRARKMNRLKHEARVRRVWDPQYSLFFYLSSFYYLYLYFPISTFLIPEVYRPEIFTPRAT